MSSQVATPGYACVFRTPLRFSSTYVGSLMSMEINFITSETQFNAENAYVNRMCQRALKLNCSQIYVEWSRHEPTHGVFNFEGNNDLEKFVQLAQDNDLFVILRPGPFIDAGNIS